MLLFVVYVVFDRQLVSIKTHERSFEVIEHGFPISDNLDTGNFARSKVIPNCD